jgi:hypothetical protein
MGNRGPAVQVRPPAPYSFFLFSNNQDLSIRCFYLTKQLLAARAVAQNPSPMNFVDLNRHFVPLNKDQEPSLDIGRFWGARLGGWLNWEDLRRRRRAILLAEASSGKTEEFRNQCDVLKAAGNPAFFLRIEELADQGVEVALDRESGKLFETWLTGSGEAWFFLDSVDEARLNRKSFDTALKRFAKDLGTGLERAHVYVSCRVVSPTGRVRTIELPTAVIFRPGKSRSLLLKQSRTITARCLIRSLRRSNHPTSSDHLKKKTRT